MPAELVGSAEYAGRNEEATGFIQCFPEGLLGLFNSLCFERFSKVYRIACCFLEADVSSPWPINRGQFAVDGDEDGQMITGQ